MLLLLNGLFVSLQGALPYPTYRLASVAFWTPPPTGEIPASSKFELTSIAENGRIAGLYFSRQQANISFTTYCWYSGGSNHINDIYHQLNGGGSPPTPSKVTVNNGGDIAWMTPVQVPGGEYMVASVFSGGQVKTLLSDVNLLDSPRAFFGFTGGAAYDISDSGIVVGEQSVQIAPTAFVWKPHEYLKLITPSVTNINPWVYQARANAVNNQGWYVGREMNWAAFGRGGVWTNLNDLTPTNSGWVLNEAFDINDNGQIVGVGTTNGQSQAFLWEAGQVTGLGALGTNGSAAAAINLQGQVVGTSGGRAFIWENGVMKDLNTLIAADNGWVLTSATDINNHGEIIGNANLGGYSLRPASVFHFYQVPRNEGGTHLTLIVDAHPDLTYVVESSTNFVNWSPVLTNVTSIATDTVTIPEDSTTGAKYFRAMLQP